MSSHLDALGEQKQCVALHRPPLQKTGTVITFEHWVLRSTCSKHSSVVFASFVLSKAATLSTSLQRFLATSSALYYAGLALWGLLRFEPHSVPASSETHNWVLYSTPQPNVRPEPQTSHHAPPQQTSQTDILREPVCTSQRQLARIQSSRCAAVPLWF